MKTLFFINIIILLCINPSSIFGQSIERNPVIISEVKSELNNAQGWFFNDSGQWVNEKNKIVMQGNSSCHQSVKAHNLGKDNFNSYELREINMGKNTYAVLIKKYIKGDYKYPEIMKGWQEVNAYDFWVFEKEILDEVLPLDLNFNKAYGLKIKPLYYGTNTSTDKKDIDTQFIINEVCKAKANKTPANYYLKLQLFPIEIDDKKQIRFIYEKDFITTINENFDPKVFDKYYYEVDFETFKNFIEYN